MSNKPMRLKELAAKYDGEWVLLGELIEHKRTGQTLGGVVLAHDPDREGLYDKAMGLRPKRSAVLCFKKMPEGHVMVM